MNNKQVDMDDIPILFADDPESEDVTQNYGTLGFKSREIRVDYSERSVDIIVVRAGGSEGVVHCTIQT